MDYVKERSILRIDSARLTLERMILERENNMSNL